MFAWILFFEGAGDGKGSVFVFSVPPLWWMTFVSLFVVQKVLYSQLEFRARNAHAGFMSLRETCCFLCECVCV